MTGAKIPISILEFRNGKFICEWEGLVICAHHYHVHADLIKALIYYGKPFPYAFDNITFDISSDSSYEIVKDKDEHNRTNFIIRRTGGK